MDEITVSTFYFASNKEEADKMKAALDKAREQATGKIRSGDVLRKIILNWIERGGMI
jgi:hypothetical protein